LFNLQVLFHPSRHIQGTRGVQQQWDASIRGHAFFQWLWTS
jgi:hypothetical protein